MLAIRSCGTKSLGSGAVDERSEPQRGGTVRRAADAIKWKIEDKTQTPARSPLAIEHIIQDSGTPRIGATSLRSVDYVKSLSSTSELGLKKVTPHNIWQ